MPIFAIALLFISATLHTTWNILLKQAGEKYIATWWSILVGSAIFLPALIFTGLPLRETWGLLLISVLAETAYYITLSTAYRDADFSLVYPLARGSAPAFIALWALLFLGEKPSLGGSLGLGIIILGLLIVGGSAFVQARSQKAPHLRGIVLALLLSLFISIYTVIDGAAVKRTPAFPYATLVFFLPPALSTPLVLKKYGWQTLKTEWNSQRLRLGAIGVLTVSAYLLALAAYSLAPVSYAGAIREVSVVMGAFAGWKFLGERLGGWRVVGAAVIFAGILVIAAWG
jgi:drug/metabolite transporter (DMT)-like permease